MKTKDDAEILTMDQAIGLLKTTRPTFYRWLRAGRIKGMKVGRQWRFYRRDIQQFLQGEPPRIEVPTSVEPLVKLLEERLRATGLRKLPAPVASPVAHATRLLLQLALRHRASDLHVAAQQPAGQPATVGTIRQRIDGVLHPVAEFDPRLLPALIEHWKSLAACDPRERGRPQDGRIALQLEDERFDVRVAFLPTVLGESLTARLLRPAEVILSLDRIDYAPADADRLRRALAAPSGLVLCTGPTGCGKTTALYACLNHLARPELKVLSIEDPVEYVLPGVVQVAVNPRAGLTFATALRSALRADPDVIMNAEIRDAEVMHICFQVALTGHLVLSTLHTEDAAAALARLIDLGAPPFLVADATRLILAQRLIRRVCRHCSVAETPSADLLARARELAVGGGLKWERLPAAYRGRRGCPRCAQTGYIGRTVIAEVLEITPEISAVLRRGAGLDELRAVAVRQGMTTMAADAVRRAALGQTTLEEVLNSPTVGLLPQA